MPNLDPILWETHKVGVRSKRRGWVEPNCVSLTTISHVTHIANALEITRNGEIAAGLVYDESTLNNTRMTVVWLSPNEWSNAGGSRYGNVEFVFDWKTLVDGAYAYQIEVQEYNPRAFRILLSEQNLDTLYQRYDPEVSAGPWRFDRDADEHLWNGQICLEVMSHKSIQLAKCLRTEFITHHSYRCCISPNGCVDRGLNSYKSGALFISGAIARQLNVTSLKLTEGDGDNRRPTTQLKNAHEGISDWISVTDIQYVGDNTNDDESALPIARAFLGAISSRNLDDRRYFASRFRDRQQLEQACARAIEAHFDIPPGHMTF